MDQTREKVIIYGSKEFAEIVRNLMNICGYEFIGFIDDINPEGEGVLGDFEEILKNFSTEEYKIVNGIGYNNLIARNKVNEKIKSNGFKTINLIHPTAIIDKTVKLGEGNIIMAGAIIEFNVKINNNVVIWPRVVVNHDSEIGSNSFLSPSSTVCGFVKVEKNSFIGAGSVIVNNQIVPENSFIKANATYYRK